MSGITVIVLIAATFYILLAFGIMLALIALAILYFTRIAIKARSPRQCSRFKG